MSDSDSAKVTIYTTSWCAFCHTEMQWLDKLGVAYQKKDIEEDKEAYKELMEKSNGTYGGVPVTDVAGSLVLGFDRPKLLDAIKANNLAPTES